MFQAARRGLSVVALTDHDTTAGWQEAAEAVVPSGVALVRGTEISAESDGISVHLLSYLHDPGHEELAREFARTREFRGSRAKTIVEKINADYPLRWADVEAQAGPGATIGRPHIADALVHSGYVRDRTEAFAELLSPTGPYYVRYQTPALARTVELVRDAGGVPVLAHVRAKARGKIISDDAIAALVEHGLAGIEVDHRDHTADDRAHLRRLARDLGLLITGSSDYHGRGKPNLLAENTTDPRVLAQIEERAHLDVIRP